MGLASPQPLVILCLDMDGTLLDANEQVHPNDVRILQHLPPGIQIILTTGRPLHSAKPALQLNGIFQEQKLPIPGVFMNGGVAYYPNEQLCLEIPLSPETGQKIYKLSTRFPDSEFVFFTVSEAYLANRTTFGDQVVKDHHINAVGEISGDLPDKIIKVMAFNDDPHELEKMRRATRHLNAEIAFSLPYIIEFNPPGVTKGATLFQLMKELALENRPIFAAGDGENDLSLFAMAKRSFAPDSARPTVLAQADQIIPRNKNGLLLPILEQIGSLSANDDYPKRPEM